MVMILVEDGRVGGIRNSGIVNGDWILNKEGRVLLVVGRRGSKSDVFKH